MAFGLQAREVDGQDVRAVFAAATEFVDRARYGDGPGFLSCNTYRYAGHHVGDINREYYRPKKEEELWKSDRDPIQVLAAHLIKEGVTDTGSLKQIQSEVTSEMKAAVDFAVASPYPNVGEVEEDVYA